MRLKQKMCEKAWKEEVQLEVLLILLKLYIRKKNTVKIQNEQSTEFETKIQGCMLSPLLFSVVIDEAIKRNKDTCKKCKIEQPPPELMSLKNCYRPS